MLKKTKIKAGVYIIKNPDNDKVYIGGTKNLYSRIAIWKSTFKYGNLSNAGMRNDNLSAITIEIIEECENYREREKYWTDKYREDGYILYNGNQLYFTEEELRKARIDGQVKWQNKVKIWERDYRKEYMKRWYEKNKKKIAISSKEYYCNKKTEEERICPRCSTNKLKPNKKLCQTCKDVKYQEKLKNQRLKNEQKRLGVIHS